MVSVGQQEQLLKPLQPCTQQPPSNIAVDQASPRLEQVTVCEQVTPTHLHSRHVLFRKRPSLPNPKLTLVEGEVGIGHEHEQRLIPGMCILSATNKQ